MNFPMSVGGRAPAGTSPKHAHKGISPIMVVAVLAIIVVAVIALSPVYLPKARPAAVVQNTSVQAVNIVSASLAIPGGTAATGNLTVTLQNPGTVAVTSVDLVMLDGVPVQGTGWIGAIPAGGTASGLAEIKTTNGSPATSVYAPPYSPGGVAQLDLVLQNGQLVAGQSYPIELLVHYINGRTELLTTNVMTSSIPSSSTPIVPPTGSSSTNIAISIQSAYISGENGVMTLTIENTGSSIINSITVTVYQSGSTVPISPGGSQTVSITPGSSWSQTFTGSFTSGEQYTIIVQASSNTGGTTTQTVTVTAARPASGATAQTVNIQSASLLVPGGAGATGNLDVALQNPGTIAVTSVDLVMFDGLSVQNGAGWIGAIPAGGTSSGTATVTISSSSSSAAYNASTSALVLPSSSVPQLTAGQSYPIQLVVHYANGQTQTITTSITASSS